MVLLVGGAACGCTSVTTRVWACSAHMIVSFIEYHARATLHRLTRCRVRLITLGPTILLLSLKNLVKGLLLGRLSFCVLLRTLSLQCFTQVI